LQPKYWRQNSRPHFSQNFELKYKFWLKYETEIKIPSQFCDRNDNPSQIGDKISILSQNNKDLFNKIFVTKKCRKFRPNLIILGWKIIPSQNSVSVWCFSCSVSTPFYYEIGFDLNMKVVDMDVRFHVDLEWLQ